MASEEKQEQTVEGGAVPPSAGKTTTQRKAATSKKVQRSLDERVPLLGGLLVILLSLLLFIAMVSHLFAWAKDQSLSWQNIFSPSELVVGNVIGPLGASLASSLVTHGFGLASFVIPLLCFMYGYFTIFLSVRQVSGGVHYMEMPTIPKGMKSMVSIYLIIREK